jgi:hypothetical protein
MPRIKSQYKSVVKNDQILVTSFYRNIVFGNCLCDESLALRSMQECMVYYIGIKQSEKDPMKLMIEIKDLLPGI